MFPSLIHCKKVTAYISAVKGIPVLCFSPTLSGAFGYFEVTHDITQFCKAKVFSHVGKRTPIAVRFSTVGESAGMPNSSHARA